ncbi:MAG: hypothetical protein ABH827_01840 [bacterium]
MMIRTKKIILALALTTCTMQMQAVSPEVDIKDIGKVEISKLVKIYNDVKACETKEDLLELRLQDTTGLTWLFSKVNEDVVLKAQHINLPKNISTFMEKNPAEKIYLCANGRYTLKKETPNIVFEVHIFLSMLSNFMKKCSNHLKNTNAATQVDAATQTEEITQEAAVAL